MFVTTLYVLNCLVGCFFALYGIMLAPHGVTTKIMLMIARGFVGLFMLLYHLQDQEQRLRKRKLFVGNW